MRERQDTGPPAWHKLPHPKCQQWPCGQTRARPPRQTKKGSLEEVRNLSKRVATGESEGSHPLAWNPRGHPRPPRVTAASAQPIERKASPGTQATSPNDQGHLPGVTEIARGREVRRFYHDLGQIASSLCASVSSSIKQQSYYPAKWKMGRTAPLTFLFPFYFVF